MEFYICSRCGRKVKPKNYKLGYGPVCYRKLFPKPKRKEDTFSMSLNLKPLVVKKKKYIRPVATSKKIDKSLVIAELHHQLSKGRE